MKEICLKTPHRVKMEKREGWHGSYKLTLVHEEEDDPAAKKVHENPVFPYRMEKRDPVAAQTYIQMIEDLRSS